MFYNLATVQFSQMALYFHQHYNSLTETVAAVYLSLFFILTAKYIYCHTEVLQESLNLLLNCRKEVATG